MTKYLIWIIFFATGKLVSQIPIFGNETPVIINGCSTDAMEPFISADGNAMFYNSLNSGGNTNLYYSGKVNDSTFNIVGLVPDVNEFNSNHLNGVASVDTFKNFYWVSVRGWPANIENLHRINFAGSSSANFGRLHGDFYINSPNWLVMDAEVSFYGNELYYCNARFAGCTGTFVPCRSAIGIAQKLNDSTFNKMSNAATIMANINDTLNYIVYAPHLTRDGLELYFTRMPIGSIQSEICVSIRNNITSPFGNPTILYTAFNQVPEAPTLTADKKIMYYHKLSGGIYKLFMRRRVGTTGSDEKSVDNLFEVYPNPANGTVNIKTEKEIEVNVFNVLGEQVMCSSSKKVNISALPLGFYYFHICEKAEGIQKIIKVVRN